MTRSKQAKPPIHPPGIDSSVCLSTPDGNGNGNGAENGKAHPHKEPYSKGNFFGRILFPVLRVFPGVTLHASSHMISQMIAQQRITSRCGSHLTQCIFRVANECMIVIQGGIDFSYMRKYRDNKREKFNPCLPQQEQDPVPAPQCSARK